MNLPPATTLIVLITGLVSWAAFSRPSLLERLLLSTRHVLGHKEYERLVTSGIIHADWQHLILNMFSFYVFASTIEGTYGTASMLLIYCAGILGGNLLSLFIHRHHDYRALGASGGVCGIIFAHIFLLPGGGIMIFPIPVSIPTWLYAIGFLVGSYFEMRRKQGNIGHDAHLGGAVIGLLTATVLYPHITSRSPLLYGAVLGLSALMFVHLVWHPLRFTLGGGSRGGVNTREPEDPRYSTRHLQDAREADRLLDKIVQHGAQSLTPEEKRFLQEHSERMRRR